MQAEGRTGYLVFTEAMLLGALGGEYDCFALPLSAENLVLFWLPAALCSVGAAQTTSKQRTVRGLGASWPPGGLKLVTCIQTQKNAFLHGHFLSFQI